MIKKIRLYIILRKLNSLKKGLITLIAMQIEHKRNKYADYSYGEYSKFLIRQYVIVSNQIKRIKVLCQ